jgi:hypothetical protein
MKTLWRLRAELLPAVLFAAVPAGRAQVDRAVQTARMKPHGSSCGV